MNTFRQHGYPANPRFTEKDGWSVFISYVGFFASSGDFEWEQKSNMFCVHTIQKGRGIFQRNGRKYEASEGDSFTFFPGDHILYHDFPESPWEYAWFTLKGINVEKTLSASGITHDRPFSKVAKPSTLESYLEETGASYRSGKYPPLLPMTAACACLDMISGGDSYVPAGLMGERSIAESFVSIIENQMEASPSVGRIASQMRIDRTTLFRAFVREHGISPKKFLENRRMDRARDLLSKTKLSVKEVSDACGFSHPGQFCKIFRGHYGATPARWRAKEG